MKLIDLYKKWMAMGTMGEPLDHDGGLCNKVPKKYQQELMCFTPNEYKLFWGSEMPSNSINYKKLAYDFTPLRQTIVS